MKICIVLYKNNFKNINIDNKNNIYKISYENSNIKNYFKNYETDYYLFSNNNYDNLKNIIILKL